MNIVGLTISFLSLASVAFGFQPELDFLGNANEMSGTGVDNPMDGMADCSNNGSPYEANKMKLVVRLKRMVQCRRGQEHRRMRVWLL